MKNAFVEALKAQKPNVLTIGGEQAALSRRKAHKLAYRYRGSSRGDRYRAYLKGAADGFWTEGRRLVRAPKFGRCQTVTVHAAGAVEIIRRLRDEQ